MVGFGDANADLDVLCENVVTAFQTVLENISPIVENLISALPTVITTLLESAGEMLPTVLETLAELFAQVLEGLLQLLPQLIPVAVSALLTITNAIVENLPLLIESATLLVATRTRPCRCTAYTNSYCGQCGYDDCTGTSGQLAVNS